MIIIADRLLSSPNYSLLFFPLFCALERWPLTMAPPKLSSPWILAGRPESEQCQETERWDKRGQGIVCTPISSFFPFKTLFKQWQEFLYHLSSCWGDPQPQLLLPPIASGK